MVENNVCEGLYDVVKVCSCLGEYDIWYQRRQRVSSLECTIPSLLSSSIASFSLLPNEDSQFSRYLFARFDW